MNKAAILGLGTATPRYRRTQLETAELVSGRLHLNPAKKRLLKSIYKATGIEYRYSVLKDYDKDAQEFDFFPNNANVNFPTTSARMKIYKNNALALALSAIEDCLSNIDNFAKEEITHIITISCTGMYAPGIDIEIINALPLCFNTKRLCINFMGCYGAFNGFKAAEAICKADANAKVLLVSVELCTIHFSESADIDNIIANSIFSDGAAAAIIQSTPISRKHLIFENFYCDLLPKSHNDMTWEISDSGFNINLSSYVPEAIRDGILNFTEKLLDNSKISFADIDYYAIHPGGLKILKACEAALNISAQDNFYSYSVLKNYGNMSSATILFVLKKIWSDLQLDAHEKNIFACAFGPGLTLESMLLKIHCS